METAVAGVFLKPLGRQDLAKPIPIDEDDSLAENLRALMVSSKGLLSEPTLAVQPCRLEPLFMPFRLGPSNGGVGWNAALRSHAR